eukprot:m.97182 g.97182  ORF g.97182 m.97182 type:complete len:291 (-) comp13585_c0_seq1:3973-4845(-)
MGRKKTKQKPRNYVIVMHQPWCPPGCKSLHQGKTHETRKAPDGCEYRLPKFHMKDQKGKKAKDNVTDFVVLKDGLAPIQLPTKKTNKGVRSNRSTPDSMLSFDSEPSARSTNWSSASSWELEQAYLNQNYHQEKDLRQLSPLPYLASSSFESLAQHSDNMRREFSPMPNDHFFSGVDLAQSQIHGENHKQKKKQNMAHKESDVANMYRGVSPWSPPDVWDVDTRNAYKSLFDPLQQVQDWKAIQRSMPESPATQKQIPFYASSSSVNDSKNVIYDSMSGPDYEYMIHGAD